MKRREFNNLSIGADRLPNLGEFTVWGPDKLSSRSARNKLLYKLSIHCLPLDVTLR